MKNLRIISRDLEATKAIQEFVAEQAGKSLEGHQQHVSDFCVRLGDLNGPRGGIDKYCTVNVKLRGLPDVYVRSEHEDLYAAVSDAIRRSSIAARRAIEKSQHVGRKAPSVEA